MRSSSLVEFELETRCEAWGAGQHGDRVPTLSRRGARKRKRLDTLEKLVETQVIPRLLLAHHVALETLPVADETASFAGRVGELAELVIRADAKATFAFVSDLREQGVALEVLFQDLLAPTARRLGELWDEDINDFSDVTRGMSQLQLIVSTFGDDLRHEVRAPSVNRRALLMPLPGEQHTFGISLVAEHFRRDGWRVWAGPPQAHKEMLDVVAGHWFDVVGLSVSKLSDPPALMRVASELRRTSLNPEVAVLVGGKIFSERPELVTAVGADGTGLDGRQALSHVRTLLGPREQNA